MKSVFSDFLDLRLYATLTRVLEQQSRIPCDLPVCIYTIGYDDVVGMLESVESLPVEQQRVVAIFTAGTDYDSDAITALAYTQYAAGDVFFAYACTLRSDGLSSAILTDLFEWSELSFCEQVTRLLAFEPADARVAALLEKLGHTVRNELLFEWQAIWVVLNYQVCCARKFRLFGNLLHAVYSVTLGTDSVLNDLQQMGIGGIPLFFFLHKVRNSNDAFKRRQKMLQTAESALLTQLANKRSAWSEVELGILLELGRLHDWPVCEANFCTAVEFKVAPIGYSGAAAWIPCCDDERLQLAIAQVNHLSENECRSAGISFQHWYYDYDDYFQEIGLAEQSQWSDDEVLCYRVCRDVSILTVNDLGRIASVSIALFRKCVPALKCIGRLNDELRMAYYGPHYNTDFGLESIRDGTAGAVGLPVCCECIRNGLLPDQFHSERVEQILNLVKTNERDIACSCMTKHSHLSDLLRTILDGISVSDYYAAITSKCDERTLFAKSLQQRGSQPSQFKCSTGLSTKECMEHVDSIQSILAEVSAPANTGKYNSVFGRCLRAWVLGDNYMVVLCSLFNLSMKSFYKRESLAQWCTFATKLITDFDSLEGFNPVTGWHSGHQIWLTNNGVITSCSDAVQCPLPVFVVSTNLFDGAKYGKFIIAGSISEFGLSVPWSDNKIFFDTEVSLFYKQINV